MHIAIMGAGGVGAYFGARLAAAGFNVSFIARGCQLEALKSRGLRVRSQLGDLDLAEIKASAIPAEIGPVDVVLFTVKLYDTETAAEALKPLVGPKTVILTLQNGIESAGILSRILGPDHVVAGLTYIVSNITEPGVITHVGTMASVVLGEIEGQSTARTGSLARMFQTARVDTKASDRVDVEIWNKFLRLAPWAGMAGVMRGEIELIRRHSRSRRMLKDAIDEIVAVAQARKVALTDADAEQAFEMLMTGPAPNAKPSMLLDLEQGRKLELPWLSGAVTRFGGERRVPTPVHNFIYAALEPYINGAPG